MQATLQRLAHVIPTDSLFMPFDTGALRLPDAFPSPFDQIGPHPVAELAAQHLTEEIRQVGMRLSEEGKMFGVLVVRAADGRIGFLRAFSGTIGGRFELPGFVPPVFDAKARANIEIPGERVVKSIAGRAWEYASSVNITSLIRTKADLVRSHDEQRRDLRERHETARRERRHARAFVAFDDPRRDVLLHELDQQSRYDKAERRRLDARHADELRDLDDRIRRIERRLGAHARLQRSVSRRLMQQIHDTYLFTNARGTRVGVRSLFAPSEPPGGAGDCCGPKLLGYALANDLEPIAMAEFWWGPPPAGGGRVRGAYYPSCREKCGPILPFLLDGLNVAPPREFVPPESLSLALGVVYQDDSLVALDKPVGLLSVPPRRGPRDSVQERLAQYSPEALLVHRLDLDTSGILIAARNARAYRALQSQFLHRTVAKRYVAIVDGHVDGDEGTIELPIRVDIHDRPRQIVDRVHGRRAITRWQVIERLADGTTRVALFPVTGRTHQLRVHCSHPEGLGSAIVGDRLYGRDGSRLLLHAESIDIEHPATGARLLIESPAPF